MAEDTAMDTPAEDTGSSDKAEKHVAYKLLAAMGNNSEGDVINLPEKAGKALVKAGLAELAGADDINGSEDEPDGDEADMPMVAASVKRLGNAVEKATSQAIGKALERVQKLPAPQMPTVAATAKEPIYRSTGHYLADVIRQTWKGTDKQNKSAWNRINAYQDEANQAWEKMGVQTKAVLGVNETTQSSGGFTVNPQFSPDIYAIPHNQLDLQAQCVSIPATGLVYNQRYINESSLANGSIFGALNMVGTAEGASFTSSLPTWANVTFQLAKEAIFVYYTSEVLEDTAYPLESEINEYVNKAFLYGINSEIIQGTTASEGVLHAPSLITVTSSANDTAFHTTPGTALTYADLANMWSQVYPDSQASPKGMWLLHPSLVSSLTQMTYTFAGSNPAWGIQYNAEDGLRGNGAMTPYSIFGKPAYAHWACSAPGTAGDILYIDFATFRHLQRPFRVEVSKDYQFGSDQVSVRFIWRGDIKTIFRNKVTGPTGSQQFSSIVTRSGSGT